MAPAPSRNARLFVIADLLVWDFRYAPVIVAMTERRTCAAN
jgi:hypothetical protein